MKATEIGPVITADYRRVVLKRFFPSTTQNAECIVQHVIGLPAAELQVLADDTRQLFSDRHADLEETFARRFKEVEQALRSAATPPGAAVLQAMSDLPLAKQRVVGALFLHEYSTEAAALFNPSIVVHPQDTGVTPEGERRVVMALRSCGEQHISSISFREGVVRRDGSVELTANPIRKLTTGIATPNEQGGSAPPPTAVRNPVTGHEFAVTTDDYTVSFDPAVPISARVLFPQTPQQSNGIEDARFVRFVEKESDKVTFYATLTAYNGREIQPQLLETKDFCTFVYRPLRGDIVNKGMALFPRTIGGRYWMLSRQDDRSILIMSSDNVVSWNDPKPLVTPQQPWEWFKMGNCGSPLEAPFGWIVLTHGVGPVRRYGIGLVVLDKDDPTKVIGRSKDPVLSPDEDQREGYVPNVVYTCGAMLHGDQVVIPYAISDSRSTFATMSLRSVAEACGMVY